jgi:hypothetical protein
MIIAGGIPHWVTSEITSHLRTNETSYRETWKPYIQRVAQISKRFQISEGGPIIAVQLENEFTDHDTDIYKGRAHMMQQLKELLINEGIVVPLTINDARMGKNYAHGEGSGDIYGYDGLTLVSLHASNERLSFDSYPQSFDCANPDFWKDVITTYDVFHRETNPDQPLYIPEFQGGAFDAWVRTPT